MERVDRSIPELEKEQTRLSSFVKKRQHLFESIGTGRVREGVNNIATDIKIGRVKARVEASRLRGENYLALVKEDLETLVKEQAGELILKANTYIDQVATFRNQLEKLQQYGQYLNPTTLEKHTRSLKALESLPGRDYELRKGLELRRQKLEQESQQEQTAAPTAVVEPSAPVEPEKGPKQTEELEISEEEKQRRQTLLDVINAGGLTDQERKVLEAGVVYSNRNFGSNVDWAKSVYPDLPIKQAIANLDTSRRRALKKLSGKIELVNLYIQTEKRRAYFLNLIRAEPPVKSAPTPSTEASDEKARKAELARKGTEGHMKFTRTLPDGQTIEIQGKITADCFDVIFKGTKENPIPADQVVKDFVVSKLRKILQPLGWNIIQPIPPQERAKGKTGVYYPEKIQKEEKPTTTLGTFTPVEAGILAVLISHLQTTHEPGSPALIVEQGVLDVCDKLIRATPELLEQERERLSKEYIGLRETVLTKTVSIISGKSFEEELSSFNPSLQIVLIWMWNQNADGRMSETIRRMLSKTSMQIRQTETAQAEAFEEFMRGTGRKTEAENQKGETLVLPLSDSEANEPVFEEKLPTTEGPSESKQPPAPITAVPLPYEQPPAKSKILTIERRNPHVRETVQEYITALKEKNVTRSMSEAQITRTFPRLKKTFLVQIREKNYIKPQVGKDGTHPSYNQSEIILSLYVYDHRENGGLNNALIAELTEIIDEELAKSAPTRIKSNPQNNGSK